MEIAILLFIIWFILLLRSSVAEYKYYQAIKTFEPEIWKQIGAPNVLNFLLFIRPKNAKIIRSITHKDVCELRKKYKQAGVIFLMYVVIVLAGSIMYFQMY